MYLTINNNNNTCIIKYIDMSYIDFEEIYEYEFKTNLTCN